MRGKREERGREKSWRDENERGRKREREEGGGRVGGFSQKKN